MFDFSWSEHTLGNVLYCSILYALFVLLYFKRYIQREALQSTKYNYSLLSVALLLIITACIDTDWFHYRDMVLEYDLSSDTLNYGEPIYWFVIKLVGKNYFLFRMIVWGGAFLMAVASFKRFEININNAVFFIVAVFLVKFNYGRATLGMASYFLGLSFLLVSTRRLFLNVLLAVVFLWGSYEFHHSMLLLIFLIPTVVLPIDKASFSFILLLLLPFIAYLFKSNLSLVDYIEDEYILEKMDKYMEQKGAVSNIFGIIQSVIGYGVFIVPLVIDSVVIFKKHNKIGNFILKLYRIMISTAFLAVIFLFMNLESNIFVYRVLYMTFIPLTILTVYLFEQKLLSKSSYKFIVIWGIVAISYVLLHLLYEYR